jgi:AcrR family transcriptional regulator
VVERCELPDEDLIAWADGYLTGARREWVETILASSARCQARLAMLRQIDQVVLTQPIPVNPAANHAQAIRALQRAQGWQWPKRLAVVATLGLSAILGGAFLLPEDSVGRGYFVRVVGLRDLGEVAFVPGQGDEIPNDSIGTPPPSEGATFVPNVPEQLPDGFTLVTVTTIEPSVREIQYVRDDGTRLLVHEYPLTAEPAEIASSGRVRSIVVQGTQVLIALGPQDLTSALFLWESPTLRYDVMVLESPQFGLSVEEIQRLVLAFLEGELDSSHVRKEAPWTKNELKHG